jgi:hypothetical protein
MKIRDIILESGMEKIAPEAKAAMRNASTFPDQNMNSGSMFKQYRMWLALAGAPEFPTKADNWIAGDPLLAPYTEAENEMINFAASQIGDGSRQTWTNSRSQEIETVQKVSPVKSQGPIQLKSKKK